MNPDVLCWREVSPHGASMQHRLFPVHADRVVEAWWARRAEEAGDAEVRKARAKRGRAVVKLVKPTLLPRKTGTEN